MELDKFVGPSGPVDLRTSQKSRRAARGIESRIDFAGKSDERNRSESYRVSPGRIRSGKEGAKRKGGGGAVWEEERL